MRRAFIDHGQRNIFRQSWQRRADISIAKATQFTERYSLKYTLDIFNVTNTASFDIPIDDVSQNINFNGFPVRRPTGDDRQVRHDIYRHLRLPDPERPRHHQQDDWQSASDSDVAQADFLSEVGAGYKSPKFAAAVSTIALPMVSEAVAAGDGTFRTCSILFEGTNWKSSTRVPLGLRACARTPEPPGIISRSLTSGSILCRARTKAGFDSDRCHSPRALRQCCPASRQNPGNASDDAKSRRLMSVCR